MSRGIKVVFQTKSGVVDSNLVLMLDYHVELAYRIVEAGIYGSMSKKHWSFATIEGGELVAALPMYRKTEANGVTRYVPRVPHNALRGSFASILMTLEALADGRQGRERVVEPAPSAGRKTESVEQSAPILGKEEPAQPAGESEPGEVIEVGEASYLVTEWEPVSADEVRAAFERMNARESAAEGDALNGTALP